MDYSSVTFMLKETDASRKCMDENNYKKDMCTIYFLKYKDCRKFWVGRLEMFLTNCIITGMLFLFYFILKLLRS